MEEENDDQWLYGEDPVGEKSDAADKVDDSAEPPLNSANPPEPEGNIPDAVPYKVSSPNSELTVHSTVESLIDLIIHLFRNISNFD